MRTLNCESFVDFFTVPVKKIESFEKKNICAEFVFRIHWSKNLTPEVSKILYQYKFTIR